MNPISSLKKPALAAAMAGLLLAAAPAARAQTITAVMHSGIRVLDPVITTALITRDHAYMIYDTLLATDENNKTHPQMADRWEVSPDGKSYTFFLRPGLKWHDGAPVTAEDCVASIKRWAERDTMGQVMAALMTEMKVLDANSFVMSFQQPTNIALRALAKPSGVAPFMMPKRIADTPSSQPIKEYIGSGPFKMAVPEFKPGLQIVYDKNPDYVPRKEPASGTAGGKVVKVDRVKWVAMPDANTAVNALLGGEIDLIEIMQADLLPLVENAPGIKVEQIDLQGAQTVMRMNHLQPPFNNRLTRLAAMYAVDQQTVMQAMIGNPKYFKTCASLYGCGSPYASQAGADITIKGNIAKAKELLKQSGYKNEPVAILQVTDVPVLTAQPVVIGQALRAAGFNVQMQPMDWQTLTTRRTSMAPVSEGGWSIFATNNVIIDSLDPLRAYGLGANGKKAWFGWPDVPKIEELRKQFALASDEATLKKLADEIQELAVNEGVLMTLGDFTRAAAYRDTLSGLLHGIPVFWNITKKGK
jgi:peptide/nickel transport system substrate-binding protein